ncbi:MAG: class I SAM-dependent methyltransferase [Nitrospira sp.]
MNLKEKRFTPLCLIFQRPQWVPVVQYIVAATCGNLYRDLVGRLPRYPIPNFRLKEGNHRLMLDIGLQLETSCIAAAQSFMPIGLDPQLGALLAAKRVVNQLGLKAHFVCGDARHLPFAEKVFDLIFSYSVLQHFSKEDVRKVLAHCNRILKSDGEIFVQMPSKWGIRCLQQQLRRGFREAKDFEVRYWTLDELAKAFESIGSVDFDIDCFFGIGLQSSDIDLLSVPMQKLVELSELLRKTPRLISIADSIYVHAKR